MSDTPDIKDYRGRWDEALAAFIVLAPFVVLLLGVPVLVLTGRVDVGTITLSGEIPVRPISLGAAALVGLTWLLSVMKIFGIAPVTWIANAADNYSNE